MKLKTKVERETEATIFERSKHRPVIISFEPPNLVGVRLKGTQRTYLLPADWLYYQVVRAEVSHDRQPRKKAQR
jgi:hypothetical protein